MTTQDERNTAYHARRAIGIEQTSNGETRGLDPRDMPLALLNRIGHKKTPLLKAIREKCIDCSGGSPHEARSCTAVDCALWPFRMGKNPFSERSGNPAGAAALQAAREAKKREKEMAA
jgi:hypothetical protein